MDPLVTSSLISAGTSLLGGAIGGGSKTPRYSPMIKAYGLDPKKNNLFDLQRETTMRDFGTRIAAARKYNLHPLTALGVAPSASPAISAFGGEDSGSRTEAALSGMGQGISRAFAAYSSREEREMAKASAKLGLENQELQNARLRSEIALMHGTGSPPSFSAAGNDADARYPSQSHMPLGYGDTAPLLRLGRDAKGNPIRVYNDDLGDNEVLQAATAFGYSIPDWLHGNITKPAGATLRRALKWLADHKYPSAKWERR